MGELERPTCKTCPYYNTDGFDGPEGKVGECRRHAPTGRLATTQELDNLDGPLVAIFPQIHHQPGILIEWCGEHPDFPGYIAAMKAQADRRRRMAHMAESVVVMAKAIREILEGARNQGPHTGMAWADVERVAREALAYADAKSWP